MLIQLDRLFLNRWQASEMKIVKLTFQTKLNFSIIAFYLLIITFYCIQGSNLITTLGLSILPLPALGFEENLNTNFKNTNQSNDSLPFYIEYPEDWSVQQGIVDEFDLLILSNLQNDTFFRIFYNSGSTDLDGLIYEYNLLIELNNKVLNSSEKTNDKLSNGLLAKEVSYEYLTKDNQTVREMYYIITNANGTFILNPRTYSDQFPEKLFDYMIKSFKPYKVQDSSKGILINEIQHHNLDMTYDQNNEDIYFIYDNDKIGIFDLFTNQLVGFENTKILVSGLQYSNLYQKLFVTSPITNQLLVYNTTGEKLILSDQIPLSDVVLNISSLFNSMNIAIDEKYGNIFIVSNYLDNITKIGSDGSILKTIPLDFADANLFPKPSPEIILKEYQGKNFLFVLDPVSSSMTIIMEDSGKIVNKIQFEQGVNKMDLDGFYNKLYLTNNNNLLIYDIVKTDNSIELINLKKIKIQYPSKVIVNPLNNDLYIPEFLSNRVIVIDPLNATSSNYKASINSDNSPIDIVFDERTNIGYIANLGSNTITPFNGTDNTPLYFVNFDINPGNAAKIECNSLTYHGNSSSFFHPNTTCQIITNKGYKLSSAIYDNSISDKNITNYSLGSFSQPELVTNFFDTISNSLKSLFGYNEDKIDFAITANGVYQFNYIQEQQIPKEFWTPFYGIIASFFIPFVIKEILDRRKNYKNDSLQKNQRHLFIEYNENLDELLIEHQTEDSKYPEKELSEKLRLVESNIMKDFRGGNLAEQHYNYLMNKIRSYRDTQH